MRRGTESEILEEYMGGQEEFTKMRRTSTHIVNNIGAPTRETGQSEIKEEEEESEELEEDEEDDEEEKE